MKKSADDFVQPVQENLSESLSPQEPRNEKPKHFRHLLKTLKNRISRNDFRFLKTIRLEKNIPGHSAAPGDLTYAPTEKPC